MGQPQSRETPSPPLPPPEVELKCITVNDGTIVNVTISEGSKGQELKFALKEQASFDCPAVNLELFIAKRLDDSWVTVTEEHRRQMKAGYVPYEIFKTMTEDNMVNPWPRLSELTLPSADQLQDGEYHLLVQKPGRLGVEPVWEDEAPLPQYTLLDGQMHCVMKVESVKELRAIHRTTFQSRRSSSQSSPYEIPIADNLAELDNALLAWKYIRWCRELWSEESARDEFQRELCSCHTVFLYPPSPELLGDEVRVDLAITSLVEAVNRKLEPDTTLDTTAAVSMGLSAFTRMLVEKLGPLFIVVDDVAYWLTLDREAPKAFDLFFKFCDDVLRVWMEIPQVYLLVLSYPGFLRDVNQRSSTTRGTTSYVFKRLNFYLLRPHDIENILRITQVRRCSPKTVSDEWKLTTEKDIAEAAQLLFWKSSGSHPIIFDLLRECRTYEALKASTLPYLDYTVWHRIQALVLKHRPLLREWLIGGALVDLTAKIEDSGDGPVLGEQLLYPCRLRWEGQLEKATIFASPVVKREMVNLLYPLRDHVRYIADVFGYLPLDFSEVFRWLCLKRWIDLFTEPGLPKDKLPAFFKENTVFGEYPSVHFSDNIIAVPQIRPGRKLRYLCLDQMIELKTAKAECWPLLLQEVDGVQPAVDNDDDSFCLKAHPLWPDEPPESPATNAILMTRQRDNTTDTSGEPVHESEDSEWQPPPCRTLTVGLVMNFTSNALDSTELKTQCLLFNTLFEDLSEGTREAVGVMTNVLVVFALECSEEVKHLFENDKGKLLADFKFIQDVVLLDLASSKQRAEFFGFDSRGKTSGPLAETIEKVVDKIVEPRAKKKRKL